MHRLAYNSQTLTYRSANRFYSLQYAALAEPIHRNLANFCQKRRPDISHSIFSPDISEETSSEYLPGTILAHTPIVAATSDILLGIMYQSIQPHLGIARFGFRLVDQQSRIEFLEIAFPIIRLIAVRIILVGIVIRIVHFVAPNGLDHRE